MIFLLNNMLRKYKITKQTKVYKRYIVTEVKYFIRVWYLRLEEDLFFIPGKSFKSLTADHQHITVQKYCPTYIQNALGLFFTQLLVIKFLYKPNERNHICNKMTKITYENIKKRKVFCWVTSMHSSLEHNLLTVCMGFRTYNNTTWRKWIKIWFTPLGDSWFNEFNHEFQNQISSGRSNMLNMI